MIVNFESSFDRDISKLTDKKIAKKLIEVIEKFEASPDLKNFTNIKKLKGYSHYYRLKIGDYRLGFSIEQNQINLIRFLHRKEIYRIFP